MTDIQALKKAAEAAIEAGQPSYAHADYVDAVMRVVKDDPATVLELCRLAEIGETVEDAMLIIDSELNDCGDPECEVCMGKSAAIGTIRLAIEDAEPPK